MGRLIFFGYTAAIFGRICPNIGPKMSLVYPQNLSLPDPAGVLKQFLTVDALRLRASVSVLERWNTPLGHKYRTGARRRARF
jgi:hypothetical protein